MCLYVYINLCVSQRAHLSSPGPFPRWPFKGPVLAGTGFVSMAGISIRQCGRPLSTASWWPEEWVTQPLYHSILPVCNDGQENQLLFQRSWWEKRRWGLYVAVNVTTAAAMLSLVCVCVRVWGGGVERRGGGGSAQDVFTVNVVLFRVCFFHLLYFL